jgi:hypothetical protein
MDYPANPAYLSCFSFSLIHPLVIKILFKKLDFDDNCTSTKKGGANMKKKTIYNIDVTSWNESISKEIQDNAINALEKGLVLFFPNLPFVLSKEEERFLNPDQVDPKTKNISFDSRKDNVSGTLLAEKEALELKEMMKRYSLTSRTFLENLLPHYRSSLMQARTSFRPVEINGRKTSSYRKDDTLLHVDAFPSSPTKGERILRIFTNINPNGVPRVWRLGDPFEKVVDQLSHKLTHPKPLIPYLLKWLKITKDLRSPFDHYMLQLHDVMKGNLDYQKTVSQEEIHFPAGSTWIVYTDQVSHAAMSGQHVLEQTYHLPMNGLKNEETAPLRILEKQMQRSLLK